MKSPTCIDGVMVCNVLVEGTTYLDMFAADDYCLFTPNVVRLCFKGWRTQDFQIEKFAARAG